MSQHDDLAWTAEAACRDAWPATRQDHLDGWLLRASGGPTRRTNSLNPTRGPRGPAATAIAACEREYAALGQPSIVRVVSLAPELDQPLADRGYGAEGHALTLFAALDGVPAGLDPGVRLVPAPDAGWLALRARLAGAGAEAAAIYAAMTGRIRGPRAFAALERAGETASMGYAVICGSLAVIESVATPERLRGQGHARRTVGALMRWARANGATGACLQVVAVNEAARALYDGLGFRTELLRYHYRRTG
jgi:ribosomal protein S18 acetylase RimI-like enzyme